MSEEKEKPEKKVEELGYNPTQIIDKAKPVAKGLNPEIIVQTRNNIPQEPQKPRKKDEVETK